MEDPTWFAIAKQHLGLKEISGSRHNQVISGWLARLKAWWRDDETPWCGTFVANCLDLAGLPIVTNWFRAKEWADYGSNLRPDRVCPGAILVFIRLGGGHVGFYVGEDKIYYHVLGGNQGNSVSITRIAKVRCIAIRWPKGVPVMGGPKWLTSDGAPSTNEA